MEHKPSDVIKAIIVVVATIYGWYSYKDGWPIEMVVLLGIILGLATYMIRSTKKEVKETEKPNYHTTKDNVYKIEIIEYTYDDEISSTTYVRDPAYLSGFKKVR